MKNLVLMATLLLIKAYLLNAQTEVAINKKDFMNDKPGFESAWKHLKDGDSFYTKGGIWYSNAAYEYKIAYAYNSSNAGLNYKLGASLLFSDKKEDAAPYLLKAYDLNSTVASDILLLTGRALQFAGQYDEATAKLNAWLSLEIKKDPVDVTRVNRYIEECKSAMTVSKDLLRAEIVNLGANINSDADDYSEVISNDGKRLFFASRKASDPDARNHYPDTKFDENIYISEFTDNKWGVAFFAGKNLRTDLCETPLHLDVTGTLLYIYTGYEGNGDIKVSEYRKGEWKSPEPEEFGINSSEPETSFSISPSGDEIAFVSDRGKKGLGGKDIWIMKRNGKKWSKPENAGESVNSDYNEESVRFSKGGDTLWFSSAGRNSVGGFDIFFSTRSGDGGWGQAVNAGSSLNTSWDELFYFPSPAADSIFYFVSNRKGGFGGLDIYSGKLLPPSLPPAAMDSVLVPEMQAKPDTVVIIDTNRIAAYKPVAFPHIMTAEKNLHVNGILPETLSPKSAMIELQPRREEIPGYRRDY